MGRQHRGQKENIIRSSQVSRSQVSHVACLLLRGSDGEEVNIPVPRRGNFDTRFGWHVALGTFTDGASSGNHRLSYNLVMRDVPFVWGGA